MGKEAKRKFYIMEKDSRDRHQKDILFYYRGVNGVEGLYGLFWSLVEKNEGLSPTLDEYVAEYTKLTFTHLFNKGIHFKNDYHYRPGLHKKTPEWCRENQEFLKLEIEERASKAWRSNMVEIKAVTGLKEAFEADIESGDVTVRRHILLDTIGGIDILFKKRNKAGQMVHLYIHVLTKETEEVSIKQKGKKKFKYVDKAGQVNWVERDFTSLSHIGFNYDQHDMTDIVPHFNLLELTSKINHHIEQSNQLEYEHDGNSKIIQELNKIKERESLPLYQEQTKGA